MKQRFLGALTPGAWIGLVVLVSIVGLAVFGPLFAPHPLDEPIGVPLPVPSRVRRSERTFWAATFSRARCGAAAASWGWRNSQLFSPTLAGWRWDSSQATVARCSIRC